MNILLTVLLVILLSIGFMYWCAACINWLRYLDDHTDVLNGIKGPLMIVLVMFASPFVGWYFIYKDR